MLKLWLSYKNSALSGLPKSIKVIEFHYVSCKLLVQINSVLIVSQLMGISKYVIMYRVCLYKIIHHNELIYSAMCDMVLSQLATQYPSNGEHLPNVVYLNIRVRTVLIGLWLLYISGTDEMGEGSCQSNAISSPSMLLQY